MQFILVDSRETTSGIPAMLKKMAIPYQMEQMPAGDYQVGEFLIERKSVADFAASIMDGRLFEQAELIANSSSRPTVLIEGSLAHCPRDLHPDALTGALSALAVFWNIQIMSTPDAATTCSLLGRLLKHQTEGLGYEVPTRVLKPKQSPDGAAAQYLISGLPGVGPELARSLLKHFGSARGVFMANADELRRCKGIGPKTANSIIAALDQEPSSYRSTKQAPPRS